MPISKDKKDRKNNTQSSTINSVTIEVTDHGLMQLYDRWGFQSYAHIIPSGNIELYPDVDQTSNVYYFNIIPTGFVVLRRTETNKFVVVTITLDEHRNFGKPITITRVRLRERQSEYEL